MRVAVPIAAYEEGTTGEYVVRAFRALGHEAKTLSQYEFYDAFKADSYDLYFCVDSGGPLNLFESSIVGLPMNKLAFWMIDYRRGKLLKNPNDFDTCNLISRNGGWVFQAQNEDAQECNSMGIKNCSWLPLGADADVWGVTSHEEIIYDVGFVGNVWDGARAQILESLKNYFRLGWAGHGGAKMEAGAALLRRSRLGFNISSFYGEPVAFDVNMRVFETLSCGVPLVTNYIPSLELLGISNLNSVRTYRHLEEVVPLIQQCLANPQFLSSGGGGRLYIENAATYVHRMQEALRQLRLK